ncbi:PREDICTED: endogenous retrovirus group K member 25 Env polyprotein-like [Chinchilla lanigera]|uniref:endogenous retrovirus group K member 25 Env polyprotein-like n=1 Tax=Chinchilla lanigera TaxID=34839 RepID=UPI000695F0BC|nr:PREDICTED: endogenous retrovirus group K member 25 Env polyprotein-like [Chinchilla lanigera]
MDPSLEEGPAQLPFLAPRSADPDVLLQPMARLSVGPPHRRRRPSFYRTRPTRNSGPPSPPTWRTLHQLVRDAHQVAGRAGRDSRDPVILFLAMLALVDVAFSFRVSTNFTYWAYVPEAPLLTAAQWDQDKIIVGTNSTEYLGGLPSPKEKYSVRVAPTWSIVTLPHPVCWQLNRVLDVAPSPRLSTLTRCQWMGNMRPLGVCFSALTSVFDPDRPYKPDLHVAVPQYHKPDSLRSCPSGLKSKQGIYAQLTDTLFVWGTWHECGFDIGHTITNTEYNPIVHDWSRYWKESEETVINYFSASYPGGLQAPSYSLAGTPLVQSQLWKLIAAAHPLRVMKRYQGCLINSREIAVEACVHSPFSLLVDLFPFNLTIRPFEGGYKLSCSTCFLTNCLNSSLSMPLCVFVLHKPLFVIILVCLPDPWEASTPIGLLSVLRDTLTRSKRFVGLVIAGIAAVITLLASASLSVVSLMETQRSASYVNEFAINMTSTLLLQEQVNHQLITRLDALEEAVLCYSICIST